MELGFELTGSAMSKEAGIASCNRLSDEEMSAGWWLDKQNALLGRSPSDVPHKIRQREEPDAGSGARPVNIHRMLGVRKQAESGVRLGHTLVIRQERNSRANQSSCTD